MKKIITLLVGILLALPLFVTAQVFNQSQITNPPYGGLFYFGTTTASSKGSTIATSTPGKVLWINTSGVPEFTATSTLGISGSVSYPISIVNGGTGTTTAPSNFQFLMGSTSGQYQLVTGNQALGPVVSDVNNNVVAKLIASNYTTAQRVVIVFSDGELVYDTTLEKFYVGDGVTAGGVSPSDRYWTLDPATGFFYNTNFGTPRGVVIGNPGEVLGDPNINLEIVGDNKQLAIIDAINNNNIFTVSGNTDADNILITQGAGAISGGDPFAQYDGANTKYIFMGLSVGIGSSTPHARLAVKGVSTGSEQALTVTDSANRDLFKVLNNGNTGVSTSSPSSLFSIGNTNGINFTTATTTFSSTGGINLTAGCYAIAGTCLSSGGSGTVTSVALTTPTGLTVSGSPITTSGTLALALQSGYNIPLTASTTNWNTFYDTPSNRITDGTGLTWSTNTLNCDTASGSVQGCLTSTDWNTFNGKQAAGNYITALTGDGTASGPGSAALTLATVNANVGSFGGSTAVPNFTVNAKGLITAAGTNAVIAPAGTLTGTTLAANVVTSSLTTVGTIATGVWNGTPITVAFGGTGSTTLTGILKGNGTGVVQTAIPGTDYQAAGNYVTALTGDVTATGPGSVAATLATVNSNVGSFTNANITVNAKGLVTAASNGTAGSGTVGSGTTGQLPYYAGSGTTLTATSSLFLAATSNVGIGTTTPTARLLVVGTTTTTGRAFAVANSAGTERVTVLDNGNVGINFTAPDAAMVIQSTNGANSPIVRYLGSNGGNRVSVIDEGSGFGHGGGITNDSGFGLRIWGQNGVTINTNGSDIVALTADISGNIGIGSTTPYRRLSVNGSSDLGTNALAGSFTGTTTATSTLAGGINITSGCYAVSGTCVGGGGGTNYLTNVSANTFLNTGSNLQAPTLEATSTTATSTFAGGLVVDTNTLLVDFSSNRVGIASTTPGSLFSIGTTNGINFSTATTTFNSTGGVNLNNGGCFAQAGVCLSASSLTGQVLTGTINQAAFYASSGTTVSGTSTLILLDEKAGVGTTTPQGTFSVNGTLRNAVPYPVLLVKGAAGGAIAGVGQKGQAIVLETGAGASGSASGDAGDFIIQLGAGAAGGGTASNAGDYYLIGANGAGGGGIGDGSSLNSTAGNGGNASGPTSGLAGNITNTAGNGGNQSVGGAGQAGGNLTNVSGDAGTSASGGANGGNLINKLGKRSGTGTDGTWYVASSTGTAVFTVKADGSLVTGGDAPTLSSCGTSPSVSGNNNAGTVTMGTGVITACTVTFSVAKSSSPRVFIQSEGAAALGSTISAKSTSAFTVTFAGTATSQVFSYFIVQ